LFRESGFEAVDDDPAVLATKGRLLKDEAEAACDPAARRRFYREAGEAYAKAAGIAGASYPLINAATSAFLAGDEEEAGRRAQAVLARGRDPDETPYYQAATEAEALLLLGCLEQARAALDAALAQAPRAWEDHASTLRQFRRILAESGAVPAWIERLRPPRCLHFAGHMALADPSDLARQVEELLEREDMGFGFGALAAGADLVIAERLVARGGELHAVLPAGAEVFQRLSVGEQWKARFERVLQEADTVSIVGRGDELGPSHIELAAVAAMGAAVMRADELATEAAQLLVLDGAGRVEAGVSGGLIRRHWRLERHLLEALRGEDAGSGIADVGAAETLAALLAVEVAPNRVKEAAAILQDDSKIGAASLWSAEGLQLAFERPEDAANLGLRLVRELGDAVRLGGQFGVVAPGYDHIGVGGSLVTGSPVAEAGRILASTPLGEIRLGLTFAQALHASNARGLRTEYVGDLSDPEPGDPVGVFALLSVAA
jgi:tetratricopeptide (TPR) repeat protein